MVRIKESSRGVKQGMTFGKLKVIGMPFPFGSRSKCFAVVTECSCGRIAVRDCGTIKKSKSCNACWTRPVVHGDGTSPLRGRTRLYGIWKNITQRCCNSKSRAFPNYGGRGIAMCHEWRSSYQCFKEWAMANGYSELLEIDRKDNNSGYSPENCRWVTRKVNGRNKRNNRIIEAFGDKKCLAEWGDDDRCNVTTHTLQSRLNSGWVAERAITLPLCDNRRRDAREFTGQ